MRNEYDDEIIQLNQGGVKKLNDVENNLYSSRLSTTKEVWMIIAFQMVFVALGFYLLMNCLECKTFIDGHIPYFWGFVIVVFVAMILLYKYRVYCLRQSPQQWISLIVITLFAMITIDFLCYLPLETTDTTEQTIIDETLYTATALILVHSAYLLCLKEIVKGDEFRYNWLISFGLQILLELILGFYFYSNLNQLLIPFVILLLVAFYTSWFTQNLYLDHARYPFEQKDRAFKAAIIWIHPFLLPYWWIDDCLTSKSRK